jgi:hypothetical protein
MSGAIPPHTQKSPWCGRCFSTGSRLRFTVIGGPPGQSECGGPYQYQILYYDLFFVLISFN